MSYRDPGTVLSAPALPVRRKRPLGLYVGIGVGVCLLVLVAAFGMYIASMASALKKPLDKTVVLEAMKGIPVYDDAVYDDINTRIQTRVVLPQLRSTYPSDGAAVIAYKTFSQPDFVLAWYDKQMQDRGYTIHNEMDETTAPAVTYQHRYRKGEELILAQAQRAPNKDDTSLILLRFTGYRTKDD